MTVQARWQRRAEIMAGLQSASWLEGEHEYSDTRYIIVSGVKPDGAFVRVTEHFPLRHANLRWAFDCRQAMFDHFVAIVCSQRPDLPPSDCGIEGAVPLPPPDGQALRLIAGAPEPIHAEAWSDLNRRINDALYRSGG